ncbi:transcriptional regulator [Rahnella inusitata]|uniref:Transcriptional regulator n=1 Tax=Rahnella inusitata TaxID=58169 RepID=A0ABX9NXB8_9GAMM|nr:transcriptional regulator [Rahnella inusitata]
MPGTHITCYRDRYQAFKHGEQRIQQRQILIKNKKEILSSGSVTVYAGRIKSLSGHLRSWTEAWIGQAPTEKFLVSR